MSTLRKIKNWFNEMMEKEQHLPVYGTVWFILAMMLGMFAHTIETIAAAGLTAITFLLFRLLARLNMACNILWLILKAQPTVKVTRTKGQEHENM